jgi:plasmid stabilization system protein ParE
VSDIATIDYAARAGVDIARLDAFLAEQDSPLAGHLALFLAKAITILAVQPGIGRPVKDACRELVVHRGRSGYLVRYRYNREQFTVTILRIRHQNESGYAAEEI